MRLRLLVLLVLVTTIAGVAGAQDATGELSIYANGEDFVRQGFMSKDGWDIQFDNVLVNLDAITAYQTDPPYDPDSESELEALVAISLEDTYLVDLAEGDEGADPLLVDVFEAAPEGQYNAVSWEMVQAEEGDTEGYTLVITGTAVKDDDEVAFTIKIETEYAYTCGEYVGDERKGILDADDEADLELTFHFDHVFGDGELPADDDLNVLAPGFDVFAALAEDGALDVDMAQLEEQMDAEVFQMVSDILPTLGHVGEGHCHAEILDEIEEAE